MNSRWWYSVPCQYFGEREDLGLSICLQFGQKTEVHRLGVCKAPPCSLLSQYLVYLLALDQPWWKMVPDLSRLACIHISKMTKRIPAISNSNDMDKVYGDDCTVHGPQGWYQCRVLLESPKIANYMLKGPWQLPTRRVTCRAFMEILDVWSQSSIAWFHPIDLTLADPRCNEACWKRLRASDP